MDGSDFNFYLHSNCNFIDAKREKNKAMIRKYVLLFTITVLWAHDPKEKASQWKIYLRGGIVSLDGNDLGGATYSRLKRTTGYTFQDIRFFGHIFKEDQDINIQFSKVCLGSIIEIYFDENYIYAKLSKPD